MASNIFSNDPSGPDSFDNPKHFWPEMSVILIASSDPGKREGLAGEAAREEVDFAKILADTLPDIFDDGDIWPVLGKDSPTEGFALHKCNCFIVFFPYPGSGLSEAAYPAK